MISLELIILFLILVAITCFLFNGLLVLYFAFHSVLPVSFGGAFFARSRDKAIESMLLLSEVKPDEKVADVGSGDGSLVIAFAKKGAIAHGYEINPFLVFISRQRINGAGLSDRAFIHFKNFWQVNFSEFDVVTVFGIGYMMKRLQTKLEQELKPGSRVVSNYFSFPDWRPNKKEDSVYLYVK